MTRDDDRDGVAIVRHANGAKSLRAADGPGNVGIGSSLAIGNRQQRAPAGELEIGAAQIERKTEFAARAREVFFQFADVQTASSQVSPRIEIARFRTQIARVRANRLLPGQPRRTRARPSPARRRPGTAVRQET